jgi:hypothetical protein
MYGLSEHETATPPPSQSRVDEAVVAQCPLLIMQDSVQVIAPRCDEEMGAWQDPNTGRTLLHWRPGQRSGLKFGVDSIIRGAGAATYATLVEQISVRRHVFALQNCFDVTRFTIEEEIIRVDHMAPGAISTQFEHDGSLSARAIFYQYSIRFHNQTLVAKSNMYRMDASQVIFSIVDDMGVPRETLTIANRTGDWRRGEWRTCDNETRAWTVDFPTANSKFATMATVRDLRVATAAAVTLMAYRDENVNENGFPRAGQSFQVWLLFRTIISAIIVTLLVVGCVLIFLKRGYEKKLKRAFYKVEAALLPLSVPNERRPVLGATY